MSDGSDVVEAFVAVHELLSCVDKIVALDGGTQRIRPYSVFVSDEGRLAFAVFASHPNNRTVCVACSKQGYALVHHLGPLAQPRTVTVVRDVAAAMIARINEQEDRR